MNKKLYTVIGLMSGTSLDGIDAALIKTDGYDIIEPIGFITTPYSKELQDKLRDCLGKKEDSDGFIAATEREMTRAHTEAVTALLTKHNLTAADIDAIGFHGHTIHHEPDHHFTWQIGDGELLATETEVDVICDLRKNDVNNGGQGAPLMPLYQAARLRNAKIDIPVAILNIGGVSNITYIGTDGTLIAFDTGPGNALLNDWVKEQTGEEFDQDGLYAAQGQVDNTLLAKWLTHDYFDKAPPKSLDRDEWQTEGLKALLMEDGAATLTAFTVHAIAKSAEHLPAAPKHIYVTGGGRHNLHMMNELAAKTGIRTRPVEDLNWSGDSLEAEGFAYFAVRSLLGEPITFPSTTGCPKPLSGGTHHAARSSQRKAS